MPEITQANDIVCKKPVQQKGNQFKVMHGGHEYYFCSRKCMHKFIRDPARYIGGTSA